MSNLTIYLAMLMLGSNFSSTTVAKQQPPPAAVAQLVDEEQRLVDLINSERLPRGLGMLQVDPMLVQVSREHSEEMAEKSYFDHVSPTPGRRMPIDRYLAAVKRRPTWAYLGENLFYCSIVDVNRGHTCLMESSKHRDNILNPKYRRVGVGVYENEKGEFWVTEMFLAATD